MTTKTVGDKTASQILAELEAVSAVAVADQPDDARTIKEWREFLGCSQHRAHKLVHDGLASGLMESVTISRRNVNGAVHRVACFRYVGK